MINESFFLPRRPLILLFFPALLVFMCSSGGGVSAPWEEENVSFPLLNMEIRHQMEENERQKSMLSSSAVSLGGEKTLSHEWTRLLGTENKINQRLSSLQFISRSIPTLYAAGLKLDKVIENERKLFELLKESPEAIAFSLSLQIVFLHEMEDVLGLFAGLMLSKGTLLEMEPHERKMLLDHALLEMERIEQMSYYYLYKLRSSLALLRWKKDGLKYYLGRDKIIVQQLMRTVKP